MISCIIVDDSPLALDLLQDYAGRLPHLKLVRKCSSAVEAAETINRGGIDLVFLDIEMPDVTGLEMIRSLKHKPKIILTTAYPSYAVQGFEVNASDYLVKPFSFERFEAAVQKVLSQLSLEKSSGAAQKSIFIKSGHDTIKVILSEIEYIEALKDYIQVFLKEGKVVSLMSMKEIMSMLPPDEFARVHRSYIVALPAISKVGSRHVGTAKKDIPIGDIYREEFLQLLKRKGIR
jgi:two-component system, LytTR family, response regulator